MPKLLAKERDRQFEDDRIIAVESCDKGWQITRANGWCFYVPENKAGIVPRNGEVVRFYGKGIGHSVRGLDIAGRTVFYRTASQQAYLEQRKAAASERKQKRMFLKNQKRMDMDYAALPAVFQARLDKFRRNNSDFRWRFEDYEMFTCMEAIKIIRAIEDGAIASPLDDPESISRFFKAGWGAQKTVVPTLSDDHSGNTFGCACQLAHFYFVNPEIIVRGHGTMCPLVGCQDYGCFSAEEIAAMPTTEAR